jgi:ligand-binding sensor domain-containing protein
MKKQILIILLVAITISSFAQSFENFYSGYFTYYCLHTTDSLIFVGGEKKINIFRIDGTYKDTKYVQGDVYSITENSQGNIYCGVYSESDNGAIVIFDGYNWETITAEDGLPHNKVFKIACDNNDNIWVTSGSGYNVEIPISKYDGSEWHNITNIGDTIDIIEADEIVIDSNNTVFVGVNTSGLETNWRSDIMAISSNDTSLFTYSNSNINLACRHSSFVDNNNHVWFGGCFNKLNRFDGTQWHHEAQDSIFGNTSFYSIGQDASGKMLLGTYGGLFKETNDGWIKYNDESGLMFNYIFDIKKDNDGDIWMAAFPPSDDDNRRGCLTKMTDSSFEHFFPNTFIGTPRDIGFAENRLFTFGNFPYSVPITFYDGETWDIDITDNDFYNQNVIEAQTDLLGNTWITSVSQLFKLKPDNTLEVINEILQEELSTIRSLACYNNTVFLNANLKLFKFNQSEWSEIDISDLPTTILLGIYPLSENRLWANDTQGAYYYDGNSWTIYNSENGLGDSYQVNDISFYGDSIWLATRHGAVLINGEEISIHLNDSSFSSGYSYFNTVHVDKNGLIWLGNNNGIALYNLETVNYIQPTEYNEAILAIREDDNCNIWACGRNAVSKHHYVYNAINNNIADNSKLNIYPNPTGSNVFVSLPNNLTEDILEVYSISGKLVFSKKVFCGVNALNTQKLNSGLYFIKLKHSGLKGKFVKE